MERVGPGLVDSFPSSALVGLAGFPVFAGALCTALPSVPVALMLAAIPAPLPPGQPAMPILPGMADDQPVRPVRPLRRAAERPAGGGARRPVYPLPGLPQLLPALLARLAMY